MKTITLDFPKIAKHAGYEPGANGRLELPATQETADRLARAAADMLPEWRPGEPPCEVVITGAGPVWGHLAIAHALHGRAVRLLYAAPNAPQIVIYSHGPRSAVGATLGNAGNA